MTAIVARWNDANPHDTLDSVNITTEPILEQPKVTNGSTTSIHPRFSYATATTLPLVDRFIDEPRSLRVAVVGGGLTGILAGILLPRKVPGIKLTIYDKNPDFV